MADAKGHRRAPIVLLVMVLAVALLPLAGRADITRTQVETACANSRAQLDEYRAAQKAFEDSAIAYENALAAVAVVERKQASVEGSVESHQAELEAIEREIEERAVELYMRGGFSTPGLLFSASNVSDVLTSSEFLNVASSDGQRTLSELLAAKGDLDRFGVQLEANREELQQVEDQRKVAMDNQQAAMNAEQAAYAKLSGRCQQLTVAFDAQEKAKAAAAAAAARRAASGSPQVLSGFICPITPGRTSFIDSWGFPRPGGRRHKGTDMFAARGEATFAVDSGTARTGSNSLGGKVVWLKSDTGPTFYYAHLDGFAFSGSQRVTKGQTVGYVGNTGNAITTAPHLHFEIRINGSPINPYPTLKTVCR